jgi:hypothetical protein
MVQLMQTGEYDGVSASGDATLRLIAGGEVAPINPDLIPNYANIFDSLKLQPHNSVDGVPYGVPHGRGANVLLYNTDTFAEPPTSWDVVWESDSPAAGAISVYNSAIYIADAALYLMKHNPDLGITNPYELDDTQFEAALDLLRQQNEIIGQYWGTAAEQIESFAAGDMTAGTSWQYQANQLTDSPVAATLPDVAPGDQLADLRGAGAPAVVEGGANRAAGAPRSVGDGLVAVGGDGDRFFRDDVGAELERADDVVVMGVIGRANDHGVGALLGEHAVEILRGVGGHGRQSVGLGQPALVPGAPGGAEIAEADEFAGLAVGVDDRVEEHRRAAARADEGITPARGRGDGGRLAGGVLSGGGPGGRGGSKGGGLHREGEVAGVWILHRGGQA